MKLYNTIAIFDVYVVAESSEKAREALLAGIADGLPPSEIVGVETNREAAIRAAWREEKPLVAADVSDEDFKKLQGNTTIKIFEKLYTKHE
jgi:hypothetical protein